MENHKLFNWIAQLQIDKKDWEGYEKCVWGELAPFNLEKKPRTLLVFEQMQKIYLGHYKKYTVPTIELLQKNISKLQDKKNISERLIKKDLNKLYDLLGVYLTQQQFAKNPNTEQIFLLSELAERGIFNEYFIKKLEEVQSNIAKQRTAKTEWQKLQCAILQDKYLKNQIEVGRNIHQVLNCLDEFYRIKKLHYLGLWENRRYIKKVDAVKEQYSWDLNSFLVYINSLQLPELPILAQFHLKNLLLIQNLNELQNAEGLWILLQKHQGMLSKHEQFTFCTYICNAYFLKINTGFDEYYEQVFKIFRFREKHGLFLSNENSVIDDCLYLMICSTAIQLGKFEWAQGFMKKFASKITEGFRENAENLCWSWWYFYQKKYDQASGICQSMNSQKNLSYRLEYDSVLLKSWYELAQLGDEYNFNMILSKIESIRKVMERKNGLIEADKSNYHNLFTFIKKIVTIVRRKKKTSKLQMLKATIENCNKVSSKKWLLAKVNEQLH